ncbi:AraC family transcriptional regulator [Nocardia crassostreae]|uniref:AraC family transcriptional regulator n=1 Tax=Nocardia crassostreae TaxID=53428 RepID=UPI0008320BA8|nr:AraC family transcriptional regulator [Nocardia crassostreae]
MEQLDGTVSTHLIRLVRDAALRAGVPAAHLATIAGTDDATLTGELNRIPLTSLVRLWELIAHTRSGPGAGLAVVADAPLGTLNTRDYLVTTGATLTDALQAAQPYHRLVTAAGEGFDLHADGDLTVGYRTTAGDPAVAAVVNEYVLAYYLRRAREATGRPVHPKRVTFGHPAPEHHADLAAAFGTDNIEFDAPADSITFDATDALAPLHRPAPTLGRLLRSHADLVLASARPIPDSLEPFRAALTRALAAGDLSLAAGDLSLDAVARHLLTSRRTLQRQLADHGTTWREEVDRARYEQAKSLLAEGRSTTTIAARLGFADDRALRKAFHRWTGAAPTHHHTP